MLIDRDVTDIVSWEAQIRMFRFMFSQSPSRPAVGQLQRYISHLGLSASDGDLLHWYDGYPSRPGGIMHGKN